MSVTIDWMDARYSIIHANFVDLWNWSELYSALDKTHVMIARSQQKITLLLDFVGSTKVTATSALFTIADEIEAPDQIYKIVIVTDDKILGHKMTDLLQSIYPHTEKIILAHTHQEAFECVRTTVEMEAVR